MLFQVIAMSVITLLLFFLLLTRKPGRINLLLGVSRPWYFSSCSSEQTATRTQSMS